MDFGCCVLAGGRLGQELFNPFGVVVQDSAVTPLISSAVRQIEPLSGFRPRLSYAQRHYYAELRYSRFHHRPGRLTHLRFATEKACSMQSAMLWVCDAEALVMGAPTLKGLNMK